jgi:hypothetical protein
MFVDAAANSLVGSVIDTDAIRGKRVSLAVFGSDASKGLYGPSSFGVAWNELHRVQS